MVDRFKDRITILEDQEIEELYGRPLFNHDERLHFFSLSPEERALADAHHNLANSVLFILQLGYFKARTMFFVFEFEACSAAALSACWRRRTFRVHAQADPSYTTAKDPRLVWLPCMWRR
jgi:hypothetical protein